MWLCLVLLEPCLVYLMRGLNHVKLSTSAADSIHKLCCQCAEHMRSQFNGLFEVIRSIDSLNISLRACLNLLKGIWPSQAPSVGIHLGGILLSFCIIVFANNIIIMMCDNEGLINWRRFWRISDADDAREECEGGTDRMALTVSVPVISSFVC